LTGRLSVAAGEGDLYSVRIERNGGSTGVPEALESVFEAGPFFVVLRETDGGRWFRTSGWDLLLGVGPTWSLMLDSPDLQADLTGLQLGALSLHGGGFAALPFPGEAGVAITVQGEYVIEVPAETRVEVIGAASVPGGWVETADGHQSPFVGPSLMISVGDGARLEVRQP
jgi:hypothetical protein